MSENKHKSYIRIVDGADTAVFMVHGIMSTPRHFDFIMPYIPDNVSVCNILLDGHGSTVYDFAHTSMKKWKAQVLSHLTELSKTHSKIIVIGYSLGTLLTLELADKFKEIKAMVLLNPPLKVHVHPVMIKRALKFSFNKINSDDIAELCTYNDVSVTLTPFIYRYLTTLPRFVELLKLSHDMRSVASTLCTPVSVFLGKNDELVSFKSSEYFLQNKNSTVHSYYRSGHFYYENEFKAQVIKSIEHYLDTQSDT